MHARVATPILGYPFSDSFTAKLEESAFYEVG
jgi:hypothetical protein